MSDLANKNKVLKNNGYSRIIQMFICICIYRIANAWMIRTQFDPDEYWQTLEPAYCLVFGSTNNDTDTATYSAAGKMNLQADQRVHGCALTWEWTRRWSPSPSSTTQSTSSANEGIAQHVKLAIEKALHGPVRSYVSILPTYWYYLACRSLFDWAGDIEPCDGANENSTMNKTYMRETFNYFQRNIKQFIRQHATYLVSKGPAFLNAVIVAAPTDLAVWWIASNMDRSQSPATISKIEDNGNCYWKSWPFWALMCSITSWFHGYALVRTYANSVETVCLIVGIALLVPELFGQCHPRQHHRPQAKLAFVLGGLSACVRFTTLAAWIPLGLRIAFSSQIGTSPESERRIFKNMLHTLFGLCATYGLLGVFLGCCVDRWFYGFWAIPFLGNIHFNVLLGNGSLYGTHPFLWYAYAGIPAICGIMLPFFLWEIATVDINSDNWTLLGIITPYIILHSFSKHKEFRFLLPILPLICILAGHAMCALVKPNSSRSGNLKPEMRARSLFRNKRSPKLLLVVLLVSNYPHLLYLGLVHQRGPIAVNRYLARFIDKKTQQSNQNNEIESTQQYSIHYLMGCHSAPLYSHLHVDNAQVNAWHLDCSPGCRSNPDILCESDAFLSDPVGFFKSAYDSSVGGNDCLEGDAIKEHPDLLVIMQDDAVGVENVLLEKFQMYHIASIQHTVKSLSRHRRSHDDMTNSNFCISHRRCHNVITLFSLIDVHFNHIEVFSKMKTDF